MELVFWSALPSLENTEKKEGVKHEKALCIIAYFINLGVG
jgi:hypothetical protein